MTRHYSITIALILFCLQSLWGVAAEGISHGRDSVRRPRRGGGEKSSRHRLAAVDASTKKGSSKKTKGLGNWNGGYRPRPLPSPSPYPPASGAESRPTATEGTHAPAPSPTTATGPISTPTAGSTPVPESVSSPVADPTKEEATISPAPSRVPDEGAPSNGTDEGMPSEGTDEPNEEETTDAPAQIADEESDEDTMDETPAPSASSLNGVDTVTRTRALFPFSLRTSGTQPPIEEINLVMETYLYQRMLVPFSNLDLISLTAVGRERRLQGRQLQTQTFTFVGDAVFVEESNEPVPTEGRVFEEQLKALQDFQGLSEFVRGQGLSWEVDAIFLDGMMIDDGDGASENGNGVNGASRGPEEPRSASANNKNGLAISLSVAAAILLAVSVLLVRRRQGNGQGDDTMKDLPANAGKTYEIFHSETSDEDTKPGKDVSFGAVSIGSSSFDAANLSGSQFNPSTAANMDWNRVFALSKTPVEQTSMDEVFEAKQLPKPSNTKTHEVVTLAPVTEMQFDDDLPYGEEDSYGFSTLPGDGKYDSLIVSSPLRPDYVEREDYSGDDRDLTMDLSDFDPRPDRGDAQDM